MFYANFKPKSAKILDFTGFLLQLSKNSVTFNTEKGELPCKSNSPLRYLIILTKIQSVNRQLCFELLADLKLICKIKMPSWN
jgi:hypothetical protein